MSFARAVVSGTLTSDPEKRFTPNNHAVTSFTLAVPVTAGGKNANTDPSQVKITCWRGLAEAVVEQLRKGDAVVVEGKLMMNSFQTQDGVQKKLFEIEAVSINKLAGEPQPVLSAAGGGFAGEGQFPSGGNAGGGYAEKPAAPARATAPAGHFSSEDLLTEDDIPF